MLFDLLVFPVALFVVGRILSGYNPKFYDTHPKYFSQNGMNLTFLNFTDKQWDFFLTKLAKRYYTFCAILSLCFNSIMMLFFHGDPNELPWINFAFGMIGGVVTFILMVHKTKAVSG
ncbi:MAG: hypothetical protein LKE40_01075 [Spirochaetia bacterium]|jgi:hypothetical protein|nr:hypothetical protein [Spirochaetia bacterium]